MSQPILRPALVLGLISALGPFTIDLYLPALPTIGAALGTTAAGMQATLTAYFAAFGLAQMIYGPWADQAGRKTPLYAGFVLFAFGTALCMAAPGPAWLIGGRVIQGLGAGALGVIPRAIIRDMMTGPEATRLMAAMMLVFSVSPMLAPLAGSGLLYLTGWRGIFGALLIACAVSALLLAVLQPETLPVERRRPLAWGSLMRDMAGLMTDRGFLLLTFIGAFGFGSFMIFLSAAAYVYAQSFGLSPTGFSVAFACNAIFFFAASQMAARMSLRFGVRRVLIGAATWFFVINAALFLLALAGGATLVPTVLGMALANAGLGLIIPTTMVMALDGQGERAGLASSLGGTLQVVAAAALAALIGPWLNGSPTPMLGGIALSAALALTLTLWAMRDHAASDRAAD